MVAVIEKSKSISSKVESQETITYDNLVSLVTEYAEASNLVALIEIEDKLPMLVETQIISQEEKNHLNRIIAEEI